MTKTIVSPTTPALNLISKAPYVTVDSNLDMALTALKPASLLKRMGLNKRSGDSLEAILYTLFIMPMLRVHSIYAFFDQRLSSLLKGGKDVVYGFMEKQSINWSLFAMKLAFRFYCLRKWDRKYNGPTAFVADDTLVERHGRKVEAASLHWDHNKGKSIKGHQFLQLGFANANGMLPLNGHIFIGERKRSKQSKQFDDKRNAIAKSFHDAQSMTKHQLLEKLLTKAISSGFQADYLLADAWFGCKNNIKLALRNDLTAIFMMKRGKAKYRYDEQLYTAKGLYRKFRKQMTKVQDRSFHAYAVTVETNLSDIPKEPKWIEVQLVFSRMKSAPKSSWVVLLCTDVNMTLSDVLKVYALRWSIEVYFKEIKQYFGFGKDQSWQYAAIMASIHLAMIRYILFYYLSLVHSASGFNELRKQISLNLMIFSYGFIAWQSITHIVTGILDRYAVLSGEIITEMIKADIETQVNDYFKSLFPIALGIHPEEIRRLDLSEKKGQI